MKYSEIRDQLRTGDLVSWKINKLDSIFSFILYLYQKILKPRSVHVGVVLKMNGRLFVVEARPPCVRLYPLSMMEDFSYVPVGLPENDKHVDYLLENMGVSYSLVKDYIRGKLGLKRTTNGLYCSEEAFAFYVKVGMFKEEEFGKIGVLPDSIIEAVMKKTGGDFIDVVVDKENLTRIE